MFAARIKELYGVVPGSLEFSAEQTFLRPPDEQIDVVHVIKGVIEADSGRDRALQARLSPRPGALDAGPLEG